MNTAANSIKQSRTTHGMTGMQCCAIQIMENGTAIVMEVGSEAKIGLDGEGEVDT